MKKLLTPALDFRVLFESLPGLYLILDPQFYIVAVSESYLKATLKTREQLIGKNLFEVFPDNPEDTKADGTANLRASLTRVLSSKAPDGMGVQKYDIPRPASEGGGFEVRYWSPVNSPLRGEDGEVAFLIHQVEDVTAFVQLKMLESKQAEINKELQTHKGQMELAVYQGAKELLEANKQLRAAKEEVDRFFSVSLDLLCIAGGDGYFKRVNPAFERVLGFSKEELCTRPILEFVHPDDREKTQREIEKQMADREQVLHFENRYLRKDGSSCWLSWKSVPIDSLMYAAARDVTEEKLHEIEIKSLNDKLVQQNTALAKASDLTSKSLQKLEVVHKELEAFSYSVSHDLRAPLRTMMGFSNILLEDHATSLTEEGRLTLGRIVGAAKKMGQLIDGLLDLSRLTRTDLLESEVNLSLIAGETLAELQAHNPDRKVTCVIAPNLTVKGDARLLRAAIGNLLSNAWKFTEKQPEARIEFGALEKDGKLTYQVRDNGAGFDMRHVDKLFGTFQRLHSAQEFQGTGIGLATVKRIIQRHGGQIWAEAELNKGATFFFRL